MENWKSEKRKNKKFFILFKDLTNKSLLFDFNVNEFGLNKTTNERLNVGKVG